jgi:hypothetical protein
VARFCSSPLRGVRVSLPTATSVAARTNLSPEGLSYRKPTPQDAREVHIS